MVLSKIRLVVISMILLAILVTTLIAVTLNQKPKSPVLEPHYIKYRKVWDEKNIHDYEIKMVSSWILDQVSTSIKVVVQNDTFKNSSITYCDPLSDDYSEQNCATIKDSMYVWRAYTINQMFEMATDCTRNTYTALAQCPAFDSSNFQGISDSKLMFHLAVVCFDHRPNIDNPNLCTVEYDATYGYPKSISYYSPWMTDSFSNISIKEFQAK